MRSQVLYRAVQISKLLLGTAEQVIPVTAVTLKVCAHGLHAAQISRCSGFGCVMRKHMSSEEE